jgi:hypothetical protein
MLVSHFGRDSAIRRTSAKWKEFPVFVARALACDFFKDRLKPKSQAKARATIQEISFHFALARPTQIKRLNSELI